MKNKTRLIIVQGLYQRAIAASSLERLLEDFSHLAELTKSKGDFEYFSKVVGKVVREEAVLDKEIAEALPDGWQVERLDKLLLSLLRAALAEREEANWLSDYVRLAYQLLDKKVAAMANAILDKLAF